MKMNTTKFLLVAFATILSKSFFSQCGNSTVGGSASNLFTVIRNSTNPVAVDKALNTVVFIHRNNANAFGGNSGYLRYDVSINGGATWTNDQGVLNPQNTSLARYPNVAIYNPTNNINPASAYISYMAATINSVSSAWNGLVSGVRQLSGAGNTENYNQPIVTPQLIPHSVVKGAPGVYWGIDAHFNGSIITGFSIYKGIWNSNANDIIWSNNYSLTPSFVSNSYIGDYNIAFDPTGTYGWFSFLSRLSPGPVNSSYYPVFYKTINGGQTWTGPYQVDLDQFSCITSNMVSPNVSTTNFEHDLVVDIYGNPHMLTTICTGNNGYSVLYGSWHHMFDITQVNGVWVAYDIANVLAGRGTWGVSPNAASMDMAPQAARTLDGTKLFFLWSDNSTYTLGAANLTPNLFGKAYDVVQKKWTGIKDFSSCNMATNGKIIFPHIATEVLEPAANLFKVAPVYGEFTVANDPLQITNFRFLDNVVFASSEFTVPNPSAVVNIIPNGPLLICPITSLTIGLSGNYGQIQWNNGATTSTISVGTSSNSSYIVFAQQGCYVGSDTIFVTNMSITTSVSNPSICVNSSASLSVSGNAFNYLWNPGAMNATLVSVSPSVTTVYTLTAGGSNNCIYTETVSLTVFPLPVISILGQDSVCKGSSVTHTVSGASTYSWSHGSVSNVASTTPTANTVYTVTGTDNNFCSNSQTISITLVPLPTVSIASTRSVICKGETCTLSASGASTYSWSVNSSTQGSIVITPSVTSTFSVVGTNTFGCSSFSQFTQTVALCTGLLAEEENFKTPMVFPNPNAGVFFVRSISGVPFSIYNNLGKLILEYKSEPGKPYQTEISSLENGVYLLYWQDGNVIRATKIIVSP